MNGKSLAAALILGTVALSAQAQKPQIQWNNSYSFDAVTRLPGGPPPGRLRGAQFTRRRTACP